MKSILTSLTLAAALLLAGRDSSAENKVWDLKPGNTWTYTCESEFHYVAIPLTQVVNGKVVRRGGYGGFGGGGSRRSGATGPGRSGATGDPQWETLTLRATCLQILPDGNARVEFMVEDVSIEVRFDSNGDYAKWDSKVNPTTDLPGFKKYEAIIGARFEAIVGPNGVLKEVRDGEWPLPEPVAAPARVAQRDPRQKLTKAEEARLSEEAAAAASHTPTSPVAWANMTFAMTPGTRGEFNRDIRMPDYERLEGSYGGDEPVKGMSCERTKYKSARVQPADPMEKELSERAARTAPQDRLMAAAQTLETVSMNMLLNSDKKGHSWFSRARGMMVKAEMESKGSVTMGGTIVSASFSQGIELKSVGKTGPVAGPELPADQMPGKFEETESGSVAR